jgi:RimJ/RimL family protein N-acetyltransferase
VTTVDGNTEPLVGLWPLFGLVIQTPTLRLRLPREAELPALARAAREIAWPGEPRLQMPWMYDDSPAMERQLLQRHWRALAHWRPESWHLLLAVFADGEPIGVQNMWADDFARRRSVGTGSWIARSRQGHGYGTEARAAVLQLAFGHLGALEAHTEYLDGNRASEQVSRKLGYTPNGQHAVYRDDTGRVNENRLRLDRRVWEAAARHDGITVNGFAACAPLFGITAPGRITTLPAHREPREGEA